MYNKVISDIIRLMDVNTPIICIDDIDFARVDDIIINACGRDASNIEEWNPLLGCVKFASKELKVKEPIEIYLANKCNVKARNKVFVLKGIEDYLQTNYPQRQEVLIGIQYLAQRILYDRDFSATFFYVGAKNAIPQEIIKYVQFVDIPYPKDEQFEKIIKEHTDINEYNELTETDSRYLKASLKGMTRFEADRVLDIALSRNGSLSKADAALILEQKKQMVKKSGLLELINSDSKMDDIGGLNALKEYLKKKAAIFKERDKAEEYGLKLPKGVFIVGMPGCGKSLCAKAAAATFEAPLLKMDMGSMMGKYVGQSEENLRQAIRIAEAAAPCVLWIDEIEKGFSGVGGNNDIMTRMFGYFLSWLQDKTSAVYVIATANNANNLPPELKRKGRFDEIFCVNLPNETEREAIFNVHLEKLRDKGMYDSDKLYLPTLNLYTKGFNGADIEAIIGEAAEYCFDKKTKPITTDILSNIIKNTVSISKSCSAQIKDMKKVFSESCFKDATTGELTLGNPITES